MRQRERHYPRKDVLGRLRVDYLFAADDLVGVTSSSTRWVALAAFLKAGEGRAERLIETEGGLIFLQSIPRRPNTGAIYVYSDADRAFLWLRFDREDDLTGRDFEEAVWAYRLLRFTRSFGTQVVHRHPLIQSHRKRSTPSRRPEASSRLAH